MKKITLLCLFFASTVVFSQNLITDDTFSTQTGAITSGTTPWAGYNSQILGSGHAEDPLVGNINNAEGALRQDFTVVPLTTYKVTFDYKWVSGAGTYDMTVRFRRQTAPAGNLTISNVTGGTLNGTSDGLVVSTTPDTWFNASFNITIPTGVTLSRLQFFKSNGNRPFRVDNVSVRKLATFDGSTDSDWATADNWDTNEIPDDDDVNIPSGQNVVISSTTGATVGNIDIDAAGSLTINGGGSLVVNANSSGNITYNRTLVVDKWHLVGSPVVGETYNDTWVIDNNIASGTGGNRGIATFQNGTADPTTGQWVYMQSGGSGTFDSSTGYSLRSDTGGTVSFTGTYPSGAKPATVSNLNANKFNLISNPYPTYLLVSDFFTNNPTAKFTENTIWLWNQATGAYVPKTSASDGAFQIAPGQAFFISSGNGTDIIFYQFNGGNATDTFLKNNRTEVSLSLNDGSNFSFTDLHYIENATKDFDNGYDASKFTGVTNDFSVYSKLISNSDKLLLRQVLPINEMETITVPIGVKAKAGKEITFTVNANNLPTGIKVFLEDKVNNTITRLGENNSNYKVILSEDLNGTGRFYLHTKSSSVLSVDDLATSEVDIFNASNSKLKVKGLEQENATITIFNILGKKVFNTSIKGNSEISIPNVSKGIYLVKLQTISGELNKKIILE